MYKIYSNKKKDISKKNYNRSKYYENLLLTAFELSRKNYGFRQGRPGTMISNPK